METRGQVRQGRGRVTATVIVGIVLLTGCAGTSDEEADGPGDEPLGVVAPQDAGDDEDASDDDGDADDMGDDAAVTQPDPAPDDDADPEPDASTEDPAPDGGSADGDGDGDADAGGDPDPAGLAEAALELFEVSEGICAEHAEAVGNPPIDPDHFAGAQVVEVRPGDPDLVVIEDGVGVELFVVPDRDEVWGGPDPDAVMPRPYGFGCPPEVYVGTADH